MIHFAFQRLEKANFLQAKTLDRVKKHLNTMDREIKKKIAAKSVQKDIKKCCHEFFMELVSSLCFGGTIPPEPELIEMLINTVFNEKEGSSTQSLTPYDDTKVDKIPTIRSFLLQLLLEHKYVH